MVQDDIKERCKNEVIELTKENENLKMELNKRNNLV